jgi:NAD(P)-dependent dehydrogenase (short-subunit alcohol dehydrogenase family)
VVAPGIVAEVVQQLGGVDILVNNAGIIIRREPFTRTQCEELERRHRNINLSTPFFLSQAARNR